MGRSASTTSGTRSIPGGVTAAAGFRAGGVACGIKQAAGVLDLGVLLSEHPCAVAGVFTRNRAAAAPVLLCRERVGTGTARAIVVNSGNANACTGVQGMRDALQTGALVAAAHGIPDRQVLVLSTGVIGVPLPMDRIADGVARCTPTSDGSEAFARAILTTDTRIKEAAVALELDGVTIHIGGAAKGSGMIHPNMATMLAFFTTDARVDPAFLQGALARQVDNSFNLISVDGDSSTNDSAVLLANGVAGGQVIDDRHPGAPAFEAALGGLCVALAKEVVRDGEGATRVIEVRVQGAASRDDARAIARAVTLSPLVKTAVFGADPNWGRVICAAGNAGVPFEPERASLHLGDLCLFRDGMGLRIDKAAAATLLREPEVVFRLDLELGAGDGVAWGCDLSYEYVRINAEYTT